jgi:hypothetical protein
MPDITGRAFPAQKLFLNWQFRKLAFDRWNPTEPPDTVAPQRTKVALSRSTFIVDVNERAPQRVAWHFLKKQPEILADPPLAAMAPPMVVAWELMKWEPVTTRLESKQATEPPISAELKSKARLVIVTRQLLKRRQPPVDVTDRFEKEQEVMAIVEEV